MAIAKLITTATLRGRDPKTKKAIIIPAGSEYTPADKAESDRLLSGGYARKAKDVAIESDEAAKAEADARKNSGG